MTFIILLLDISFFDSTAAFDFYELAAMSFFGPTTR
jgi:hypothetical protein